MDSPFRSAISKEGLTEEDLNLLDGCFHRVAVKPRGSEVCPSPRHLHLLLDGWACQYRLLANGRRQIIGLNLAGDVCDIDRLFCRSLSFGVEAMGECRVAEISIDLLKSALDARPAIRDLFWSLTVLENTAMAELVTSLGSRSARERVAWFLCDVVARLQIRGKALDGAFRLELTQTDIADMLGLSVVHINRTLKDLKSDGLISSQGSTYKILDPTRLRAAAGIRVDEQSQTSAFVWTPAAALSGRHAPQPSVQAYDA